MNRWQEPFAWSRKSPVWLRKGVCLQRERIGALLREFPLSFQTAKARRAGRRACFWEQLTDGCQTRLTEKPHGPTADDSWLSIANKWEHLRSDARGQERCCWKLVRAVQLEAFVSGQTLKRRTANLLKYDDFRDTIKRASVDLVFLPARGRIC